MLAASAVRLAYEINADALLILVKDSLISQTIFEHCVKADPEGGPKIVLATSSLEAYNRLRKIHNFNIIKLAAYHKDREDRVTHAIAHGMREGIFSAGHKLVCLTSDGFADGLNTLSIRDVRGLDAKLEMMSDPTVAAVIEIAIELGLADLRSGPIGTAFMIGDSKRVMERSYQLMLNPFRGCSLMITDRKNWPMIRRYATFDGAFIVERNGRIIASSRYLDAQTKVDIPRGLGTRHIAVASMTSVTETIGVTVSGEDSAVRIFRDGKLEAKIDPKSRSLSHYRTSRVKRF